MMGGNGQLSVPPGFRFHPTEEELLYYYLRKKVSYEPIDLDVIREVDLNKLEPWDLKEKCRIGSGPQNEWYFFSHKDKKYPTGTRTNRATAAGFWKATGRDKAIHMSSSKRIGMRKTLVFYTGRAPHGHKTDWIMHEYRLDDDNSPQHIQEDGWVVCRVFKKKNHTRGYQHSSQLDQHDEEVPINVLPPFDSTHHDTCTLELMQNSDQSQYKQYTFDHHHHHPNISINLPQLLSPESMVPNTFLSSLPLNSTMDVSQNLLRMTTANGGPSSSNAGMTQQQHDKFSGDWSFLDKLLATQQTMDHISKSQHQFSSQVADHLVVPNPGQRFPFPYQGFEPDFSK